MRRVSARPQLAAKWRGVSPPLVCGLRSSGGMRVSILASTSTEQQPKTAEWRGVTPCLALMMTLSAGTLSRRARAVSLFPSSHAKCRAVCPLCVLAVSNFSGQRSSSIRTTSVCPPCAALCSAVCHPSRAPAMSAGESLVIRSFTTFSWPFPAAVISALQPTSCPVVVMLSNGYTSSISSTASMWPPAQAKSNALAWSSLLLRR
mmetsp:Transcript_15947/g.62304  ORF Transcript_15947/g.62304 Transcript_15947/m.62304 type:complete len:204 (-) Transcript_15947:222-833(-)